jgi:hypothetical protein
MDATAQIAQLYTYLLSPIPEATNPRTRLNRHGTQKRRQAQNMDAPAQIAQLHTL